MVWWFPNLRRKTVECVPIKGGSLNSASLGKLDLGLGMSTVVEPCIGTWIPRDVNLAGVVGFNVAVGERGWLKIESGVQECW